MIKILQNRINTNLLDCHGVFFQTSIGHIQNNDANSQTNKLDQRNKSEFWNKADYSIFFLVVNKPHKNTLNTFWHLSDILLSPQLIGSY